MAAVFDVAQIERELKEINQQRSEVGVALLPHHQQQQQHHKRESKQCIPEPHGSAQVYLPALCCRLGSVWMPCGKAGVAAGGLLLEAGAMDPGRVSSAGSAT